MAPIAKDSSHHKKTVREMSFSVTWLTHQIFHFFQFNCYAPINAILQISIHFLKLDVLSQNQVAAPIFIKRTSQSLNSSYKLCWYNTPHFHISTKSLYLEMMPQTPWCKKQKDASMTEGVKKQALQIFCMKYSSADFYFTINLFHCNPHQFSCLSPQPEFEEIDCLDINIKWKQAPKWG